MIEKGGGISEDEVNFWVESTDQRKIIRVKITINPEKTP